MKKAHRIERMSSSASVSSFSSQNSTSSKNLFRKSTIGRAFSSGSSSLSKAIMEKNWNMVVTICETSPKLAKVWTKCPGFFDGHRESKLLPLHQICAANPPNSALEAVLNCYPKALNMKETGYSRLPVHIACHSGASLEMLQILLRDFPESVTEGDMIGRVPLHYACSNGASLKVVMEIVSASPRCVAIQDMNGWLALHVACRVGAPTPIVNYLLEKNPSSASQATSKRNYPLTLVNMEGAKNREEVVTLIKFYAKLSLKNRPETNGRDMNYESDRPPRYTRQSEIEAKERSKLRPSKLRPSKYLSSPKSSSSRRGFSSNHENDGDDVYDSSCSVDTERFSNSSRTSSINSIRKKSRNLARRTTSAVRRSRSGRSDRSVTSHRSLQDYAEFV